MANNHGSRAVDPTEQEVRVDPGGLYQVAQVHPLVSLQGLLMASRPQLVGVDASVALANYTTWNFSDEGVAAVGFFANLRGDPAWSANAEVRWTW